ncbi:MAG: RNA polymerase II mediator complex subunit [Lichina confinis]|nr:MAG: RNA polymerase II mediator complex subunit [Lichina confinis]
MADRLTQLQDALDQLATQFYACIRYIHTNHSPPAELPPTGTTGAEQAGSSDPTLGADQNNDSPPQQGEAQGDPAEAAPSGPPIPSPEQFQRDQRELARDLILKEQQIEVLISGLPGIGTSELEQQERIKGLIEQLKDAEGERQKAMFEKERLLEKLDAVIMRVRRV